MSQPNRNLARGAKPTPRYVAVGVIAWTVSIAGGMSGLAAYSHTPGRASTPAGVEAGIASDQPWTLMVAVHPKCPCTLATIGELERLLSRVGDRVRCVVYAYTPADDAAFAETRLIRYAGSIPGVSVVRDPEARSATAAGLFTSGAVLLRDRNGAVRFHGGITAARGHEGDNAGARAIRSLVSGAQPAVTHTPIYGCQITSSEGML